MSTARFEFIRELWLQGQGSCSIPPTPLGQSWNTPWAISTSSLLMSVNPGFGGQSFISHVLETRPARSRDLIDDSGRR